MWQGCNRGTWFWMRDRAPNTYNGWANYETWNVALYIQNEYDLYLMARKCNSYLELFDHMTGYGDKTPDGVSWADPELDLDELNELLEDL